MSSKLVSLKSFALAAVVVVCGFATVQANTYTLGPNNFTVVGNTDGGGTRANFDFTNPITLAPNAYALSNFSFEASQAGDAVPVLATVTGTAGSGSETYTIIAVGNDAIVSGAGMNSLAEHSVFQVTSTEKVYAGFVNVTTRIFHAPIGVWPKNKVLKLVGLYWRTVLIDGLQPIALGPMTRGLKWTKEEVDLWLEKVLLSYMDAFLLLAIMNAACIPLVIMTIKKRSANKEKTIVVVSDH